MTTTTPQPLSFTGKGSEYFKIWIVNLCLSVLTLGIYSAWAKVRRLQYFYRHTQLADACLDYHGDPFVIFKGRVVAFILFGSYSFFIETNPKIGLSLLALIMLAMPWMLVRSFRFQLHNTSYRGLRFSFHGTIGAAFVSFLLMPLLSYLSLGLLWPLARKQITHYLRSSGAYGNCSFAFHGTTGQFYKISLMTFASVLLYLIAVITLGGGLISVSEGMAKGIAVTVAILMFLFGTLFILDIFSVRLQNYIWNNTSLGEIRFVSELSAGKLFLISLSNGLLIFLTLGFYKPYADIRLTSYRIGCLSIQTDADIDSFLAKRESEVAASGEEIAEMFDMDIAF